MKFEPKFKILKKKGNRIEKVKLEEISLVMDKEGIKEILNKFPEVRWDRYTEVENESNFFGWIKRKDMHSDFLVLSFINGRYWWYMTSSAKFSKEIAKRLGKKHIVCKRVEELFGEEVNCIHLKKSKVKSK